MLDNPAVAVPRTRTFERGHTRSSGTNAEDALKPPSDQIPREEFVRFLEADQSAKLIGISAEAIWDDIL